MAEKRPDILLMVEKKSPKIKSIWKLRLWSRLVPGHAVPEYDCLWALTWKHPSSKYSHKNSGPWFNVLTLYSGTKWYLGTWSTRPVSECNTILCWCPGNSAYAPSVSRHPLPDQPRSQCLSSSRVSFAPGEREEDKRRPSVPHTILSSILTLVYRYLTKNSFYFGAKKPYEAGLDQTVPRTLAVPRSSQPLVCLLFNWCLAKLTYSHVAK